MAILEAGQEVEFWSKEISEEEGWRKAVCRGVAKVLRINDNSSVEFFGLPQGVEAGDIIVLKES